MIKDMTCKVNKRIGVMLPCHNRHVTLQVDAKYHRLLIMSEVMLTTNTHHSLRHAQHHSHQTRRMAAEESMQDVYRFAKAVS